MCFWRRKKKAIVVETGSPSPALTRKRLMELLAREGEFVAFRFRNNNEAERGMPTGLVFKVGDRKLIVRPMRHWLTVEDYW